MVLASEQRRRVLSEGGRVRGAEGERDDLLQLHVAGEVANLGPVVAPVPRRETKDPQPQLARMLVFCQICHIPLGKFLNFSISIQFSS